MNVFSIAAMMLAITLIAYIIYEAKNVLKGN